MTPDEYFKKYVGGNPTGMNPEATPTSDITNDVPIEARTSVPAPSDYAQSINSKDMTMPHTPESFYAKYVMPTSEPTPEGPKPITVTTADMIQNKDKGQYNGFCQRFVEDATYGKHGIFDSAISAWNQLPNKVRGLQGVKPGDLVYFSANAGNNNDGHVGIYEGNGVFKSATSKGIEDQNIGDWMAKTGQQVLGYVPV